MSDLYMGALGAILIPIIFILAVIACMLPI